MPGRLLGGVLKLINWLVLVEFVWEEFFLVFETGSNLALNKTLASAS